MSSFRRKVSPSTSVARQSDSLHDSTIADSSTPSNQPSMGFKPSVYNSLGIVSSGHAQLDEILGGGMQCGTTMLLGTDIHSNFADTLMAYGLAEALSMRQHCLILTQDPVETRALIDSLAYNRTLGTDAPGSKSHFGCSYDLSRRLQPNIISWQGLSYYTYERPTSAHSLTQPSLADVTAAYVNAVVNFVRSLQGSVGRIFLHGLHHVLSTGGQDMTAAALRRSAEKLILSLRAAVRSTRITLTISALPEALPGSSGVAITLASNSTDGGISATSPLTPYIALVDTALTVDTFAGRNSLVPYEFKDFCGFLVVERIQHFGTLVGHRPIALRYGLKRDRRKLHVDRLHLPPEESRAQGPAGTDSRL